MIASGDVRVEEDPTKLGIFVNGDASLLAQLPGEGFKSRFAGLDASTREVPARHIRMPDEKDTMIPVEHDPSHPEGQSARETPVNMKHPLHEAGERA
jgi:hypothetical protein